MLPVDPRLETALMNTEQRFIETRAEIWDNQGKVADVEPSSVDIELADLGDSVSMEIAADWLTGSGITPAPEFYLGRRLFGEDKFGEHLYGGKEEYKTFLTGILVPIKNRVRIYTTFKWQGLTEEVYMGEFVVTESDIADTDSEFTVNLSAEDCGFIVNKITSPTLSIPKTTDIATSLRVLLPDDDMPTWVSKDFSAVTVGSAYEGSTLSFVQGENKSAVQGCNDILSTEGLYLRGNRWAQMKIEPSRQVVEDYPAPSFDINDYENLVTISINPSGELFANKVTVYGESPEGTVEASAVDDWTPYGTQADGLGFELTNYIVSENALLTYQASNIAYRELEKKARFGEVLELTIAPYQTIEVGDTFTLTSESLGLTGSVCVVNRADHSLNFDQPTKLTARRLT